MNLPEYQKLNTPNAFVELAEELRAGIHSGEIEQVAMEDPAGVFESPAIIDLPISGP